MLTPKVSWFEKYRPKSLDEMVFSSESQRNLAQSWIQNERIDGNVLLSGAAGTGKTTLAEILIRNIIKNQSDLCRMKTRSVNEIDEKVKPFVAKKPVSSKIKIVYIEEIDGISRQGQRQLKEDLLEKYQDYVSFLACTNYPKRIDGALYTRFTYKINFTSDNIIGIKNRLKYILNCESAIFDEKEFDKFIEKNYYHGLRSLINSIQVAFISGNGKINFEDLERNLNIEDNLVKLIHTMLETIMKTTELNQRKLCLITPLNSIIAREYQEFVTLCHNNYDINYENVFSRLYETTRFLPLQVIIGKYSEETDMKKYPHIHLISCFYEMVKCVTEVIM